MNMQVARLARCAIAMVALQCLCATGHAGDLREFLTGYSVARWDLNDGVPEGSVYALAQDRDGFLWLGSDAGLHRFNGMRFTPWNALSAERTLPGRVQALRTARDGSLWVGFDAQGGVSRIRGTSVRNYSEADGLPAAAVITIVEDGVGTIWVGNDAGLFQLKGDRWSKWPGAGLPDGTVWSAHVDERGTLFVAMPAGLFKRLRDSPRFEELARFADASPQLSPNTASRVGFLPDALARSVVSDLAGRVFLSDFRFGFRLLGDDRTSGSNHRGRGLQLLFDRKGYLWVGTSGQGVWRVTRPTQTTAPVIERLTSMTGLAAEGAFSLLEDRDGNIWAGGTPNGLTRLTPQRFLPVRHESVVKTLAVTPGGHLWVGTSDSLNEVADPDRHPASERRHLAGASIHALHVDASGTLWVATQGELLRVDAHRHEPVKIAGSDQFRQIDSITSDSRHGLLLADVDRGLLRWTQATGFEQVRLPAGMQASRIVTIFADSQDRVWVAFAGGMVAVLAPDGKTDVFDAARGFDAGEYRIVHEDDRGVVWLGGTNGITRYAEGRVVTIHGSEHLPIRKVRAIVHDQFGFLWIGTDSGFLRIDRDVLLKVASPSFEPAYTLYDKFDGLAGLPSLLSDSTSARTSGGALWFVTAEGISIVEPRALDEGRGPAMIGIDAVTVDDHQVLARPGLKLPAGTRRLQIEFTALNLTSPHKTRFRFRLDGIDGGWIDAGTRHQASYTNLGPGPYRFRVAATGVSGEWREPMAGWEFSINPHFYQTWWFVSGCGSGVLLLGWAAWTLRLGQERSRFSLVLGERARLSREIHDTLLQGLVGVGLQCDALGSEFEGTAPETKERFVRMRKQTQRYIKEARQAIWDLRGSPIEREDLPAALRRVGDEIADPRLEFQVDVTGVARVLDLDVERQLVRIAHEAVTNAARHAAARRIQVDLEHRPDQTVLRVVDDGRGFDEPDAIGHPGHYGILSMRERAESIHATFDLQTSGRGGTRIEVVVPAPRRHLSAAAV